MDNWTDDYVTKYIDGKLCYRDYACDGVYLWKTVKGDDLVSVECDDEDED